MNPAIAKPTLKVVGVMVTLLLATSFAGRTYWAASGQSYLMARGSALLALYFVRVGYLACFRFSPRTVCHICGCCLFGIWSFSVPFIGSVTDEGLIVVTFAVVLAARMIHVYRRACRYFVGLLFGQAAVEPILAGE